MLKLNSMKNDLFAAKDALNSDVRVNGQTISRQDIVAGGRLIVAEYFGKRINQMPNIVEKYSSRLNSSADYAAFSRKHQEKKFMFCAAQHYKHIGAEMPDTFAEVSRDLTLAKSQTFLATLAAIDRDVITPMLFDVFNDIGMGGLIQMSPIAYGSTKQIDIKSNDVFLFEDSSFGSGRSATYNYLYGKTLTFNPTVKTCQVKIKWYQDIVNGEAGDYYAAIMRGYFSKLYAISMSKLLSAAANTDLIPAGLTANTYTSDNWALLTTKIAAVNGVTRNDLVAFGGITQLNKILPVDGTGGAIAGLQYGLGGEWVRRGYLPNVAGVDLLEITPVIVPGTQNSTIDMIDTGNNIFIGAKGGYKPIYVGYYEGTPLTIEMTPSQTADFTIDINAEAIFDAVPVFASKVGVIKNVANNG